MVPSKKGPRGGIFCARREKGGLILSTLDEGPERLNFIPLTKGSIFLYFSRGLKCYNLLVISLRFLGIDTNYYFFEKFSLKDIYAVCNCFALLCCVLRRDLRQRIACGLIIFRAALRYCMRLCSTVFHWCCVYELWSGRLKISTLGVVQLESVVTWLFSLLRIVIFLFYLISIRR